MNDSINDLINTIPLDKKTNEYAQKIIQEDDLDETKKIITLFNLNQAKKNVLRVLKLNSLLDKVSDQMIERFEKRPGEFSNADLLNYLTVTQNAIDRANKSLALVDETPAIQLNQVNVNINNEEGLDRESRLKVTEAVKAIMSRLKLQDPIVESDDTVIINEDVENESQEKLLNEENEENE